nr:uncharacterized protein LOC106622102 [Bactrocera oleae]
MNDGKKRLSGAEYRKRAEIRKEEQKEIIRQTVKIYNFLRNESKSIILSAETSNISPNTIQSEDETDTYSAACDSVAEAESSVSPTIEDSFQNQTSSPDLYIVDRVWHLVHWSVELNLRTEDSMTGKMQIIEQLNPD